MRAREFNKFYVTEEGKVTCKICLNEYSTVNASHLKTHNITIDEYRVEYPFTQLYSISTLRKCSANGKANQNNPSKLQLQAQENVKKAFKLTRDKQKKAVIKRPAQAATLREKAKRGLWYNPTVESSDVRSKISEKAKKRYEDPNNWVGVCKIK